MEKLEKNQPNLDFLRLQCEKAHGLMLLSNGWRAFNEVKGIKRLYFSGVFLTFCMIFLFFSLGILFLYLPVVEPLIDYYVQKCSDYWSWVTYIVTPLGWLMKFFSWLLLFIISYKLAVSVMSFWLDRLLLKVIDHFRQAEESGLFSVSNFIRGLFFGLRHLPWLIIMMLLGSLPVLGMVLVFVGTAWSFGYDILNPYLLILSERDKNLLNQLKVKKKQALAVGTLQSFFGFVPVLGWLLQPFTLVLQIIGFAFCCEEQWQNELNGE